MTEGSADQFIIVPVWLVRLCKWCWYRRGFLFGTVLLSVVLNLLAALPLVDPSTLHTLPIVWLSSHWPLLLGVFGLLLLLTVLCGLIARLSVPFSTRQLRAHYLERMRRETELVTLKGIPAGLISESVRLADVYIPPNFYANRARVDFPVSDEELERYRQSLKRGPCPPELERMVFEAEKNWQHTLKKGDQVGLGVIWQQFDENNAVVIQGYPGMGKSTLMERLTLYMAGCGLHQPDPDMPERENLTPALIPVLLRLGSFARALAEKVDLSLPEYLCSALDDMDLPGLAMFMKQNLLDGTCLVMLDGLDEVSEPGRREQVQREIRDLISGNYHRCRFIITSRVAGYDQAAFPAYPHFMLAELSDKEIDCFLPRWCRANLDRERAFRTMSMNEANIAREVEWQVQELKKAIKDNQGVHELAKNPLLLTLLLVMQQNSIILPRQRVELYDTVTKTLLENRNIAKELNEVPEFQAIERLGPLAFQMQEADSDLIRQYDVGKALMEVIRREGGTEEQVSMEAQRFLQRVRERGGLFVSRVGDYFGFMHRTFQEYFAARYILNQMKTDQQRWVGELIQRARRRDALWREPFLLAVAYQSGENEHIASEILRALLADANRNSFEQEVTVVLLAADAIIEAKPLTILAELQQVTAKRLLVCYERGLRVRDIRTCEHVEYLVQRWLCSLPKEAYRLPPLLEVVVQAIKERQQGTLQRAVLTLLTLIAQRLEPCPELVFETIIPPLLTLTHLPAIGPYSPAAGLAISPDFGVVELALCVLSFLGRRGPAGLYLETVRDYFDKRPKQLCLLARYSLECGTLITPIVVPLADGSYRQYEAAIGRWIMLQKRAGQHITEQNIVECLNIQQSLLACAEEVSYPTTQHLLAMLDRSEAHAEQPWPAVWQDYLLEQLNTGSYIDYQEVTLLWNALFPTSQLYPVVNGIMEHYTASDPIRKRYAQRLIAYFLRYLSDLKYSSDLKYLRDLKYSSNTSDSSDSSILKDFVISRYLRYLAGLKDLRGLRGLEYLRYFRYLSSSSYLGALRALEGLRQLKILGKLRDLSTSSYLNYITYLSGLNDLSDLNNSNGLNSLSNLLVTRDSVEIARLSLLASQKAEKIDLLAIIQERILQFQVFDGLASEVEIEAPLLVRAALQELELPSVDGEVREAVLGMLRSLPARTVADIALIWELLNDLDQMQDEQIRSACADALRDARPIGDAAWQELEKGKRSNVKRVRDAVEQAMERKK